MSKEYSSALTIVSGLHSRNELKAAHAAQAAAVYLLTIELKARAIKHEYDTRTASMAGKQARTFTAQRDAFERIRKPNRTSRQSIKLTKESHYRASPSTGGAAETDGRPYDASAATSEGSARCRATTGGQVLRLPNHARPRHVQFEAMAGFDAKDATSMEVAVPAWEAGLSPYMKGKRVGIPRDYRMDIARPSQWW